MHNKFLESKKYVNLVVMMLFKRCTGEPFGTESNKSPVLICCSTELFWSITEKDYK